MTRLRDFLKFLVTNFLTKVAQMYVDILGYFGATFGCLVTLVITASCCYSGYFTNYNMSPGQFVMEGGLLSSDCEFEYWHQILDESVFSFTCCKIVSFEMAKNKL